MKKQKIYIGKGEILREMASLSYNLTKPARALAAELADKYGKAFIISPQSVKYNPKSRELQIQFRARVSGLSLEPRAKEVAHSFEDFVETLFCKCASCEPDFSSEIFLSRRSDGMPIATIYQEGRTVYIKPRTELIGNIPVEAIWPAYKKSILMRNARA